MQGEGLTYQWLKAGEEVQSDTATSESLVVRNPEVHDTGFYTVRVSNEAGSVQSARACMIVQLDASQQPSIRTKAASTGDASPLRGGRAAARRRRMLDGAATQPDSRASVPTDHSDHAHTGDGGAAPSLLTQPASTAEVEALCPAEDAG